MIRTASLSILAILLLSACGEAQDTRPGQPVAHRRAAFKEMLEISESMSQMLQNPALDSRTFQALTGQLMAKRDLPWSHFGPDTRYPPSKAKAEVWTQADKFTEEKQAFLAATDKLSAAAGNQDRKALETAYGAVQNTCKSCHKLFKER